MNCLVLTRIDKIEMMAKYFEILKADLIEESNSSDPLSKSHRELIDLANNLSEEETNHVLQMMKIIVQGLRK